MIIIDDFIKDYDFLNKIENDEEFWQFGYQWYDGWWNKEVSSLREELIYKIWGPNSPHDSISTAGFEHWVGDYSSEGERHEMFGKEWALKLHFDKDEEIYHEEKRIVGPIIGTVFYPCREIDEIEGGLLTIWENFTPDVTDYTGMVYIPDYEPEVIKPKFNRLVIFNANSLHAVTAVTKGRRRAIAINLWDEKPREFTKDY